MSKERSAQNRKHDELEKQIERTAAQQAHTLAASKQKRAFLGNKALFEDSHLIFPKIDLLSDCVDQILRYGCLPQYCTGICETSHKGIQDAYR